MLRCAQAFYYTYIHLNLNTMKAVNMGMRDAESIKIDVLNDENEVIASGHYNIRTNFAHVTTENEDFELEDSIQGAIEARKLEIN